MLRLLLGPLLLALLPLKGAGLEHDEPGVAHALKNWRLSVEAPDVVLAGELVHYRLLIERLENEEFGLHEGQPGSSSDLAPTEERVVLRESLPVGARFVPEESTPGWTCVETAAGTECFFADLELDAGGARSLDFAIRIDASARDGGITNTAHLLGFDDRGLRFTHEAELLADCDRDGEPDVDEFDCDEDGIPDDCGDACLSELDGERITAFEYLAPLDTLCHSTRLHAGEFGLGYFVATAVDASGASIAFDHLIGHVLVLDGVQSFEFGLNPIDHRAQVPYGSVTDLDRDGACDLDGREYEPAPAEFLIPRFFGQDMHFRGRLLMLDLTGSPPGATGETTLGISIMSDDESVVTVQVRFRGWEQLSLTEISPAFTETWLRASSCQNRSSVPLDNAQGWFSAFGIETRQGYRTIPEPAVALAYIATIGPSTVASLPFERGARAGQLAVSDMPGRRAPTRLDARSSESAGSPRRRPGSLLIFPLFDHRTGVVTLATLTNTNARNDTRVRLSYFGRYGH